MRKTTLARHIRSSLIASLPGLFSLGCRGAPPAPEQAGPAPSTATALLPPPTNPAGPSAAAPAATTPAVESSGAAPDPKQYAWLGTELSFPKAVESLAARFPAPPGYVRAKAAAGSFAAWLRNLPVAATATPVTTHAGEIVRAADDDYVAAVLAIDTGSQDLQQSADVILRLQAEWLWSLGQKGAINYLSATKLDMPLSRWEKGQRLIADGPKVFWAVKTKPQEVDYGEFRKYLDAVFTWANSTSLSIRAKVVDDPKALVAGDFFLHGKPPGHVAVVLDVADKPSGERVALLGQALNPAQSLHVVRPGRATAWFSMRAPQPVVTPHTAEFGWDELRRLAP